MAKKSTRPRHIPYPFACTFVQAHHIRNRAHYQRWVEETKPPLPKWPDRVYPEWESWNHYLRNNEEVKSFERTRMETALRNKSIRPLWEALRWSHQIAKEHTLTSERLWHEWAKAHPDQLPSDIPKNPDQVYSDWCGWPTWLGKSVAAKVVVEENMVAVLALHSVRGSPTNVVQPHVHKNGYLAMVELVSNTEQPLGPPHQVFDWEPELKPKVDQVLGTYGRLQDDQSYIVPNVPQLLWELSDVLLIHPPPRKSC